MSLNVTTKTHATDELLTLNIKVLNGGDQHYISGQTITYSFFNFTNSSIFNAYNAGFPGNLSHDPNIWNTNPNWVTDVDSVMNEINKIINLTIDRAANFTSSDVRWTAVNDLDNPGSSGTTGYSFITPSEDKDGQGDGDDAGILLYNRSPVHTGSSAEAELGGANERTSTILHEFGHFLGLSHPFVGDIANAPFVELNDSKYDVMSYTDSDFDRKVIVTNTGGGGTSTNSSYNFGTYVNYSPINMAQLQYLYGANTNTNTGGTAYTLTDAQTVARDLDGSNGSISIGRAYYTIWDNGGIDEIKYSGSNRVLLNLNAATLNRTSNNSDLVETLGRVANSDYYTTLVPNFSNEITDSKYYAGGFFSQILTNDDSTSFGVNFNGKYANTLGGYAIANGVVIENATAGGGNDLLIGNYANNILSGNNGDDTIFDANGHDTVMGGSGNDIFYVGRGNDAYDGGGDTDRADFASVLSNYQIFSVGGETIIQDIVGSKYGSNTFTNVENFTFSGINVSLGALPTSNNYEILYADLINNELVSDAGGVGNATNDTFWGTNAIDQFYGELLNDRYEGKTGSDIIEYNGNRSDFNFSVANGGDLMISLNADNSKFDVLHSVEQLSFDDGVSFVSAGDLGLSGGDFTTWQNFYDFG